MRKIYESKFVEDIYDESESLIISRWFNAIALTNDIYREEMMKHVEAVEQHRPKYMLIDTADFANFAIDPEVQEWASTEVFLRLQAAGVQKMAFVVSPDVITQMSIEQQEDQTRSTQQANLLDVLQSFDNEMEALAWLRNSQPTEAN